MALYTVLDHEALADVLRRWGLPPPDRVLPEPKGSVNTNYHLWAGGRRLFLRLAEGKSAEDVAFEAEVLRFLTARGFPVPPLLLTPAGEAHLDVAGRPAMLFGFVEGMELERHDVTPDRCAAIGEALGRLHALAPGFAPRRSNPYGRERVRRWVESLLPDGGGDPLVAAALPTLARALDATRALPPAPEGLLHGDLFLDNVLWGGDRIAAVLDWEMSCTDAFAYDLAVLVNAWCYGERFEPSLVRALLGGYRRAAAVDAATRAALHPYATYVALRYTASRIHAFHRATLSADRLAWKDWTRYRDRLEALFTMGEAGFARLVGG